MRMNRILVCLPLLLLMPCLASGQSPTLQDIGGKASEFSLPEVKIYTAKEIVTLDPAKPTAQAVAVVGDRILATGTLAELKTAAGDQKYSIDNTFADKVYCSRVRCTTRPPRVNRADDGVGSLVN